MCIPGSDDEKTSSFFSLDILEVHSTKRGVECENNDNLARM